MEKLNKAQLHILEQTVALSFTENFYLAGGAALTIKYDHRPSKDFYFFALPNSKVDFRILEKRCQSMNSKIVISTKDALIVFIYYRSKKIKFSFFDYNYPLLKPPEFHQGLKIFLASDEDIACMKALDIVQKGTQKDFFDLWYLMKRHNWTLADILSLLNKKFPDFQIGIFLKSLLYFENADKETYPKLKPYWGEIKDFFQKEVKSILFPCSW